ncbi:WecB/TagA/CpsF family glycosyltransferase [Halochromatium glycolicum]|uniref:N-acetylglucosaminyldiphosphoundecaprenol N-acetyl-beta-D-mannosaminyltransferase n=1 Tax=Halochromatium glycolicum TaxID=85075 RepID=A0AAJ0U6U4_9GAMM|nr:WecB/TagA/CpsF family glycosyltransferase [Halochromatium glycolicum]MBK1706379.1 hypothetical protein [Halochromatium glycolicum]
MSARPTPAGVDMPSSGTIPERFDVHGCRITRTTLDRAVSAAIARRESETGGYACFVNVHVAVTAQGNESLRAAINESWCSFPDGKPIYWAGRVQKGGPLGKVSGPDFLPALLAARAERPLRHYFYGSTESVLEGLRSRIGRDFPEAVVVGMESPPFRPLSAVEVAETQARIRESGADFVWVGLGAPKQELWMEANWQALAPALLFGVGAAFDFHAGVVQRAPAWMCNSGLEWLHRLATEPRRLWWRYLTTNSRFLWLTLRGAVGRGLRPED